MNTAPGRFRTVAIAATAAAATVLASGFITTGVADAQHSDPVTQCLNQMRQKDYRLQRARDRARNYKAAYNQLRGAMLRMENVTSRRVMDQYTRSKLLNMGANARRLARNYVSKRYQAPPPAPTPPPVVVAPPPTVVTPPAPPPQPAYQGPAQITHRSFRRFKRTVRRASFDKDRVALVRDMRHRVAFTSNQVFELMRLCSFDRSRVDVAAALYRNVVDPQNWYVVYNALSFSSSKKKLRKRIRRHRGHRGYR